MGILGAAIYERHDLRCQKIQPLILVLVMGIYQSPALQVWTLIDCEL